jgi:hypothetical protein
MKIGQTKNVLISLAAIAATTSMASAQRTFETIDSFKLDLVQAHQHKADTEALPEFFVISSSDLGVNSSLPMGFKILIGNQDNQSNGYVPSVADLINSPSRGQVGVFGLDAIPKEDSLNIVPLPPAALGGLGLLAGLAGVRYLRRNK